MIHKAKLLLLQKIDSKRFLDNLSALKHKAFNKYQLQSSYHII